MKRYYYKSDEISKEQYEQYKNDSKYNIHLLVIEDDEANYEILEGEVNCLNAIHACEFYHVTEAELSSPFLRARKTINDYHFFLLRCVQEYLKIAAEIASSRYNTTTDFTKCVSIIHSHYNKGKLAHEIVKDLKGTNMQNPDVAMFIAFAQAVCAAFIKARNLKTSLTEENYRYYTINIRIRDIAAEHVQMAEEIISNDKVSQKEQTH